MITVRIENTPKVTTAFRKAIRGIGFIDSVADRDPESVWYNVVSEDDDKLESLLETEETVEGFTRW